MQMLQIPATKGRCRDNHFCLSIYGVYIGATWRRCSLMSNTLTTCFVRFFVCHSNISGTVERICAKFTGRRTCLVRRSDKFERQGHQGQKQHFSAHSAACVQFMFDGKTSSLDSSLIILQKC